jgi:hypothetical protein
MEQLLSKKEQFRGTKGGKAPISYANFFGIFFVFKFLELKNLGGGA